MAVSIEILTRKQAANELHVNPRTIDRWKLRGWLLPAIDTGAGGTVRYRREDVEAMKQSEHKRGRPKKSA